MKIDSTGNIRFSTIVIIVLIILSAGIAYVLLKPEESKHKDEPEIEKYDFVNLNTTASQQMIDDNMDSTDFVILDVRTPDEFSQGHIENATLLNYYEKSFSNDLDKLDKTKTYLVYCRTGSRSANAAAMMIDQGFQKVYNMLGGITTWNEMGYDTVAG